MSLLLVLADANILVKDVVSSVLFDLSKSKLIDLKWTPQIEAEYVQHRARLRANSNDREPNFADWIWAQRRLYLIKKYLVPEHLPPGWQDDGKPAADLLPFDVHPLHPGDVLDLVDLMNADGLSNSLKKTAADFKNPQFSLMNMLASIRSAQQFDNATLASRLQKKWGLI